jgi:hypothetical protein
MYACEPGSPVVALTPDHYATEQALAADASVNSRLDITGPSTVAANRAALRAG